MGRAESIRGLYGIADAGIRPELAIEEKARLFVEGGASVVQVRMKAASARDLWKAALRAREAIGGRAMLVVNDRPDVALAANADGVHVGDEDLPIAEVRRIVGPEMIVGATVRTLEQALEAKRAGADYVGFGPVFPTSTKQLAASPRGLEMLEKVAEGAGIPVVAIAGMTVERAASVARAGAAAAAVVSDVLLATDPRGRARAFHEAFLVGLAERCGKA